MRNSRFIFSANNPIISNGFLVWFVGFWEGEGHISKFNRAYTLGVTQAIRPTRTTEILMIEICHRFGGTILRYKPAKRGYFPQLKWELKQRDKVLNLLKEMLPYSQLRKDDIQRAIMDLENIIAPRNYAKYMKQIICLVNSGWSYKRICKAMKPYVQLSPSTLCHILKQGNDL